MTAAGLTGVELLSAAARVASRRSLFVVATHLEKAAMRHRWKGCPAAPLPCAYEIEAAGVLASEL